MVKGVTDDDSPGDDADKGPVKYQEAKVFGSEQFLITVYDNLARKVVYFQVYGLDTQAEYWLKKEYQQFDLLFRFNAELMNPNKKEPRFHWVIERLEIVTQGHEIKLQIGSKPTGEISQLPLYDEKRKIPTGRMDFKERQRLRETMDMLDIRREENIRKKRAKRQEEFLKHIFEMQAEDQRRKQMREEQITGEIAERLRMKDELEAQETREKEVADKMAATRRRAVELKEQRMKEQDEENLRQMKSRWKASDQHKARLIKEARDRKAQEDKKAADEEKELLRKRAAAQMKREQFWSQRDDRIKVREAHWLKGQLELLRVKKDKPKLKAERMKHYLKELQRERGPIFAAQLARSEGRANDKIAEERATALYKEERALPRRVRRPRSKAPAAPKKGPKVGKASESEAEKTDDDAKKKTKKSGDKADGGKAGSEEKISRIEAVLDTVEAKMRAEMAEERRRQQMHEIREQRIANREKKWKQAELEKCRAYKQKWEANKMQQELKEKERHDIMRERNEEMNKAEEKRKREERRLERIRADNVQRYEAERLARLCG